MSYEVNDRELESVLALPAATRFDYFLNRIADWEEVWSLADQDGWVLTADDDGNECVPVWPARRFAEACCLGKWQNNEPRVISLDDWCEKWLPGMAADRRRVAVFPLDSDKAVVMRPQELLKVIDETLEQYE